MTTSRSSSAILLLALLTSAYPFAPIYEQRHPGTTSLSRTPTTRIQHIKLQAKKDDDDETIDLGSQDWRAFRAKLVMGEPNEDSGRTTVVAEDDECLPESGECDLDGIGNLFGVSVHPVRRAPSERPAFQVEGMTPLDPSQWAYDSGKVVEQGAVILGGVEQEYGFGLRQQYFHKAAILVLEHEEATFTKGIILNRPTDLVLDDDLNPHIKWRVWFGGDVQGLASSDPHIICIHHLRDPKVTEASIPIMNDIQWTTFDNAKSLVHAGVAKPKDFWVFVGYSGWGPHQLMGELDRKSWYMVAADSQTLLKELGRQSSGADPRDAGLDTWTLLMHMIGRGETADDYCGEFDDLMLKEWARAHLLSAQAGGGASKQFAEPVNLRRDPISRLLHRAEDASPQDITPGTLVRASAIDRSPFLLEDQELHKSVILILSDDDNISIGALLNRPVAKGIDIQVSHRDRSSPSARITLPLRFGGQYSIKGNEPLLWLHCNPVLRSASIGSPLGPRINGIWKCSADEVTSAVAQGLAAPKDFLVVTGVTVWTKWEGGAARGIQGEIQSGKFEVIPEYKTQDVWEALSKLETLSPMNMLKNLQLANESWTAGESDRRKTPNRKTMVSVSGLGENCDEEDDSVVFKSDVPVSKLADDALRTWVATFLLNAPALGG